MSVDLDIRQYTGNYMRHWYRSVDLLADESVVACQHAEDLAVLDVLGPDVLLDDGRRVRDGIVSERPAVIANVKVDVHQVA